MPFNRILDVTVNFTGTQAYDGSFSGTATYVQSHSMPEMLDLVASNGDIDLSGLPYWLDYNWAIGMNFTLNAVVTDRNGNTVVCHWASPLSRACAITGPGGGRAIGMEVTQSGPVLLSVANANDDRHKNPVHERTYGYKLGVMLPGFDNYFISLDPQITNTGPTSPV